MIILTPEIGLKILNVIPRYEEMAYLTLRDDSNNTTQLFSIDNVQTLEWYSRVEFTTEDLLLENRYYDLTIYALDDSISYKDRIFVTSQPKNNFSVNVANGEYQYKQNNSDNDFLTYGE